MAARRPPRPDPEPTGPTAKRKSPAKKVSPRVRKVAAVPALPVTAQVETVGEERATGRLGHVIGNHVRARRVEIGLNVGQLADRSGISKGMLSKIENAQTSPSLATLERLAAALDMPFTALFRGVSEERDAVFVKAGSGSEIVRQGTRAGHTYELLGSLRGPMKKMEPLLVTLQESKEVFPVFQHSGIELLYMLDGVIDYGYGSQVYRMSPGDTLQFEGEIPHGPVGLIELPIRFLSLTVYDRA